jgi:flagellar biosynthetic protein FliR
MEAVIYYFERVDLLLIVYLRALGVVSGFPVLDGKSIPVQAKLGLALVISIIAVPIVTLPEGFGLTSVFDYLVVGTKEVLIGLMLGYISGLFTNALYVAGQLIDIPMGFGMANVLDPRMEFQVPLMGKLLYLIAALVFLSADGHLLFLAAFFDSFDALPISGLAYSPGLVSHAVRAFCAAFALGFKMGFPIMAALFLVEVGLGIMSRSMPQLNIFVLGFPIRIAFGLAGMMVAMPVFVWISKQVFQVMYEYMFGVFVFGT